MASIASALSRIKWDLDEHLGEDQITRACAAAGHTWRDRVLDPATTLRLFVLQVLHGNVACRALRHLGAMDATAEAYCAARKRLPIDVFGSVCAALVDALRTASSGVGRWRGHRVWMVDGTGVSMPDTPALQRAFGQPAGAKPGCGFPVAHVLMLMDMATGLIGDFVVSRGHTHDMSKAARLHPALEDGDVLVGDRAFGSWTHFALLLQANLHGVCRQHQRRTPGIAPGSKRKKKTHGKRQRKRSTLRIIETLGSDDHLVELQRTKKKPTWISDHEWNQLPGAITLRRVSYRVTQRGHRTRRVTLMTTLADPRKYPRNELAELYGARWRIETNLRHLKTTMRMDVLRCKSVDGVTKELWVYVIVYNLVRRVMLDEAQRRGAEPDRVSFTDALDALRHGEGDRPLMLNPDRPGRMQPRTIKRRKDRYTYMTRPRDQLRQALLGAGEEVTP